MSRELPRRGNSEAGLRLPSCFIIGLLTLALSSLSALAQPAPSPAGLEAKVNAYLKPYVDGHNFSGVVLIAWQGSILLNKGYGMADYALGVANSPATRFHIASVSKPFTAAALQLLEERGLLSTADPVARFIPDYPDGDRITLRHLLTHTSGIPNVNDLPEYEQASRTHQTPEDLVAMFKDKPLEFEPGADYRYSNSNYNLLAHIIEKVSGRSYGEFLELNIFQPLGIKNTGHDGRAQALIRDRASGYVPVGVRGLENAPYLDWSIKTGNGSLYSTADDLYRFDRALYSNQLLSEASRAKMFAESGDQNSHGWFVRERFGRRLTAGNGRSPGFTSSLERFVDDDVCIIVLSNLYISTPIAADLAAIVFDEPFTNPADIQPIELPRQALAPVLGHYQFGDDFFRPGITVTVRLQEDDLLLDWGGGFLSPLIPLSETRFIDRNFWAPVTFVVSEQGQVIRLLWHYEKDYPAEKLPDSRPQ